jgi:hypothetical protein
MTFRAIKGEVIGAKTTEEIYVNISYENSNSCVIEINSAMLIVFIS